MFAEKVRDATHANVEPMFGKRSVGAANQRTAFRQAVEQRIEVRVGNARVPVMLLDVSATGCRMRTGASFQPNAKIEFQWSASSAQPILLYGRVAAKRPIAGNGFEYGISFDILPNSLRERVAHEVAELQRQEARKRTTVDSSVARKAGPPQARELGGGKQKRQAYRAQVQFPVKFVDKTGTMSAGTAGDLSEGGIRLTSPQSLAVEEVVELRFTLPPMTEIGAVKSEEVEVTPFGRKRVKVVEKVPPPFAPMRLRARVKANLGLAVGGHAHGMAFENPDNLVRDEIRRFIHLAQLLEIRKRRHGLK